MNKVELINAYYAFLQAFNLTPDQVGVGSGGCLLMLRLRKKTADIDASVPTDVFEMFRQMDDIESHVFTRPNGTQVDVLTHPDHPLVDIHKMVPEEKFMSVEGVTIYTPMYCLEFKLKLQRKKDQDDIRNLLTYIGRYDDAYPTWSADLAGYIL